MIHASREAVVRPAVPNDLDAVATIERQCFNDPWSRRSFAALVNQPGVCFLVLDGADALAGYAVAYHAADEAELANLAVAAGARRLGIGRALLDAIVNAVRRGGASDIWLEVRASNDAARALYRGFGFEEAGLRKRYYDRPVEDAIVMRRSTAMR
ncbi:MAG: ribosomal protein S18-alanine N-acetyltransferase [Gemmatimonadaceae bacterium]